MQTKSSTHFVCLLLALSVFMFFGCQTPKPVPDPLAGWIELVRESDKPNQAITDDFQSYLQSLPPRERDSGRYAHYYKVGDGQHALKFKVPIDGADWAHILIYDKNDKRVKVFKYIYGYSRS